MSLYSLQSRNFLCRNEQLSENRVMCRALLSGLLCHLENVILFIRNQVACEMNFCISVQECPTDYLDTPKQALSPHSYTSYEATYVLKRSGAEKFDQNHFLVSSTRSFWLNFCISVQEGPTDYSDASK